MAILKHIASKNANYGSAIDYLKYQHDEFHLVPVLDENGNMMLREEFYLEGLNCDPETFDLECELLNQLPTSRRRSAANTFVWSQIAKTQDFVRTVGMGNGIPIKIAGNEKSRK